MPYVAQEQDGSFDSLTSEIVAAAPKISICAPLMTWVIIGIPEVTDDAVYAGGSTTAPPNTGETPSSEIGSLEEWIPEQLSSATAEKQAEPRRRPVCYAFVRPPPRWHRGRSLPHLRSCRP